MTFKFHGFRWCGNNEPPGGATDVPGEPKGLQGPSYGSVQKPLRVARFEQEVTYISTNKLPINRKAAGTRFLLFCFVFFSFGGGLFRFL